MAAPVGEALLEALRSVGYAPDNDELKLPSLAQIKNFAALKMYQKRLAKRRAELGLDLAQPGDKSKPNTPAQAELSYMAVLFPSDQPIASQATPLSDIKSTPAPGVYTYNAAKIAEYEAQLDRLNSIPGLSAHDAFALADAQAWLAQPRCYRGLIMPKEATPRPVQLQPLHTLHPDASNLVQSVPLTTGVYYHVSTVSTDPDIRDKRKKAWGKLYKTKRANFRDFDTLEEAVRYVKANLKPDEAESTAATATPAPAAMVDEAAVGEKKKSQGQLLSELLTAVQTNNVQAYRALIASQGEAALIESNSTALTIRSFGARVEVTKADGSREWRDSYPRGNALHVACEGGHLDMVEEVLRQIHACYKHKADNLDTINADDKPDLLPLTPAMLGTQLLTTLRSYLDSPFSLGDSDTPVMKAAKKGHYDIVRYLLTLQQFSEQSQRRIAAYAQDLFEEAQRDGSETGKADELRDRAQTLEEIANGQWYCAVIRRPPARPFADTEGRMESDVVLFSPERHLLPRNSVLYALAGPCESKRQAEELLKEWTKAPVSPDMVKHARQLKQALYAARDPASDQSTMETDADVPAGTGRITAQEWHEYRQRRKDNPAKGHEQLGRVLARRFKVPFEEYWPFVNRCLDLSTLEGLAVLDQHLHNRRFVNGRTPTPADADAFIAAREEPSLHAALEIPDQSAGRHASRTRGLPWEYLAQYPRVWAWASYFQSVFDTVKMELDAELSRSNTPTASPLRVASPQPVGFSLAGRAPASPLRSALEARASKARGVSGLRTGVDRRGLMMQQPTEPNSPVARSSSAEPYRSPSQAGKLAASPVAMFSASVARLRTPESSTSGLVSTASVATQSLSNYERMMESIGLGKSQPRLAGEPLDSDVPPFTVCGAMRASGRSRLCVKLGKPVPKLARQPQSVEDGSAVADLTERFANLNSA